MPFHLLHHRKTGKADQKTLLIGDILGWVGAASLISAYLMVSFGVLSGDTILYQALNIAGAAMLTFLGLVRRAVPSAFTNIVWVIIGLVAIFGIIFR